jgi:hypothetical protein
MTAVLSPEPAPVLVAVGEPAHQRRLSVLARPLLALPHLVALVLVAPSVLVVAAVGWFWSLVVGRLPLFAAVILSGYLGWQTRVLGYLFLLTDVYPPFTLSDPAYPVRVTTREGRLNRFAVLLRPLLALPAAAVAVTATAGLAIVLLFAWLSTVVTGRLPSSLHQGVAAYVRYQTRLAGYLTMVTSEYPWGLLGDPENRDDGMPSAVPAAPQWGGAAPARQPTPPSPTRDPYWRLVLSPAAKNTVVLLLVLGVASVVALNITSSVSRFDRVRMDQTATARVQSAYQSLTVSVVTYQGQTRACSDTTEPLACLTQAAQSVSDAFTVFVRQITTTTMPPTAASARRVLVTDGAAVEADFAHLSSSTSAGHYELLIESSDLPRLLTGFDRDYAALGVQLTN